MAITKRDMSAYAAEHIAKTARRLENLANAADQRELAYYAGMLRLEAEDQVQVEVGAPGGSDVDRDSTEP